VVRWLLLLLGLRWDFAGLREDKRRGERVGGEMVMLLLMVV
jgi:hypothetical protein